MAQFGAEVVYADEASADPQGLDPKTFDVVLVDRIEAESSFLSVSELGVEGYLAAVAEKNPGVWVTASAFGLSTPKASLFVSEVTLLASAGILGHSRIADDLPPTIPAAPIGLRLVGTVVAVAALHGLHERQTGDTPVHVDLSAQGAVIATGLTLEAGHALVNAPDQGGSARYGAPTGMFACTDGSVYVLVLEEHQWKGIHQLLAPALDEFHSMEEARSRPLDVSAAVAAWASTRTQFEAESALQAVGVPCTAVNTVNEFVQRVRASGRTIDLDGAGAPMLPANLSTGSASEPARDAAPPASLRGLRVLDAGHVLAVPLATAWLGAMGARVAKLEDPRRLDVYRRRGPFADGVPGLNRGAYFNHINFNKDSLDLSPDADANARNIESFDVVISNLSPHRARLIGVDPDGIAAGASPKFVMTSSGFGLDGQLANYRAYGTNIHAFSGLVAATRDALGNMAGVGTPWADPLTSVAIAAWVLAWSLNPATRANTTVDLSMAEVLAAQLAELFEGDTEQRYDLSAGLDFFVRLSDSSEMLAVSPANTAEATSFEQISAIELSSLQRRGGLLTGGSSTPSMEKLEHELRAAGIRAARVVTAKELARDESLVHSELFQTVESPALGAYLITGLPWRLTGRPSHPLRAAPERPHEGR
jgi:crotonobetainyl-CoA:carnitine CoA-transferase CaiB-like acyl-CoA transferase